jgi:hypothetical protein
VSTIHGIWGWLWILASNEEARRFRVQASMHSIDRLVALQWKGPVHSVRKSMKEITSSGQVFIMNSKEIRCPFTFRKGSNDGKKFWRTEIEILQVAEPLPTSIPYLPTTDEEKANVTRTEDDWAFTTKRHQEVAPAKRSYQSEKIEQGVKLDEVKAIKEMKDELVGVKAQSLVPPSPSILGINTGKQNPVEKLPFDVPQSESSSSVNRRSKLYSIIPDQVGTSNNVLESPTEAVDAAKQDDQAQTENVVIFPDLASTMSNAQVSETNDISTLPKVNSKTVLSDSDYILKLDGGESIHSQKATVKDFDDE